MSNIVFDNAKTAAVIDILSNTISTTDKALSSAQTALSTLKSIGTAGGDLSSQFGGTVTSGVSNSLSKLSEGLSQLKSLQQRITTAKELMNQSTPSGDGQFGKAFDFSVLGTGQGVDIVEKQIGNISAVFDMIDSGDMDGAIVKTIDIGGDVLSEFTDDPLLKTMLGNTGSAAEQLRHGSNYIDNQLAQYIDQYRAGDISIGQTIGKGTGAAVTNGVVSIADAGLNLIGIDIPDSWVDTATDVGGWIGDKVGIIGETAVSTGIDVLKTVGGGVVSMFSRLFG